MIRMLNFSVFLGVVLTLNACVCCVKPTAETFSVNNVYGDHMVLQRQKPIKIVGIAEAGKSVKVTIGDNSVVATAGKNNIWTAVLPAMEAGGPYTVTVSGADKSKNIVFKDVLVGEVWFCSGQSNMQMPVVGGRFWCSKNGKQEAAAANFPQIRIFQVARVVSPAMEQDKISSKTNWEICTPQTIGKFSACGFYFGRELHKYLNVPIGLINASWGGTRIEPWISRNAYEINNREKELNRIKKAYEDIYVKKIETKRTKWVSNFYGTHKTQTAAAAKWQTPEFDVSAWEQTDLPAGNIKDPGVFWFRRDVEIPADWAGKKLVLDLGVINEFDEAFFNGHKVGATTVWNRNYATRKRVYNINGKFVKAGKNTIAVRVSNVHGVGGFKSGALELRLSKDAKISLNGKWFTKCEFAADTKKIGQWPSNAQNSYHTSQFPATLYNSMVKPWTVYPMRGFIWYQGCSNAGHYRDYMNLHPMLIKDWRNKWNDESMPFIFAQLAAYYRHSPAKRFSMDYLKSLSPGEAVFANLREVQTATLKVPLTGMGVAIDIGDHSDIHPANKQDLAFRMAQEAKRLVYGYKGVTAGPMYKSMKIEGDKIRIEFSNIGKGLIRKGDNLNCFAIAAEDGKFVWANAKIDNNSVIVWADSIKKPAKVRYAWAGYPIEPNLYNKEGFPAVPFRTDTPDYLLK